MQNSRIAYYRLAVLEPDTDGMYTVDSMIDNRNRDRFLCIQCFKEHLDSCKTESN